MLFLLHYICIGYFQEYQSVWLISSWKLKHVDQQSHVRALKAEATILVNQLEQWKNKNKIIILSKSKMPPIVKIVFFFIKLQPGFGVSSPLFDTIKRLKEEEKTKPRSDRCTNLSVYWRRFDWKDSEIFISKALHLSPCWTAHYWFKLSCHCSHVALESSLQHTVGIQ